MDISPSGYTTVAHLNLLALIYWPRDYSDNYYASRSNVLSYEFIDIRCIPGRCQFVLASVKNKWNPTFPTENNLETPIQNNTSLVIDEEFFFQIRQKWFIHFREIAREGRHKSAYSTCIDVFYFFHLIFFPPWLGLRTIRHTFAWTFIILWVSYHLLFLAYGRILWRKPGWRNIRHFCSRRPWCMTSYRLQTEKRKEAKWKQFLSLKKEKARKNIMQC